MKALIAGIVSFVVFGDMMLRFMDFAEGWIHWALGWADKPNRKKPPVKRGKYKTTLRKRFRKWLRSLR